MPDQNSRPNEPELVVGLVGAIGTDLDTVKSALEDELSRIGYRVEAIRLSKLLDDVPQLKKSLKYTREYERYDAYMKAGTLLRELTGRGDALAMLSILAIRQQREKETGDNKAFPPRHAFLLQSLKHPSEVETLRRIYGSNFLLISAYAPEEARFRRLAAKLAESEHVFQGKEKYPEAQHLLQRDEAEPGKKLGQQVRKAFPLADVFIDTTEPAELRKSIGRFLELYFGYPYHTPTRDEYGMSHAQTAANRSSAMGRQVGAAITTKDGDIVVVGTNEVPKAGGGLYWPGDNHDRRDFVTGEDINDKLKYRLLGDILQRLRNEGWLNEKLNDGTIDDLVDGILADRSSAIGGAQILNVIEYGRCVHAEMAALVDAARRGVAVAGCTLYTSTFPCHECARHIVAAGILSVVYIDPYPKSLVQELLDDSIALESGSADSNKVVFRPFVGVSPRLYVDLFQQSDRKDNLGNAKKWKPHNAAPRDRESGAAILVRESAEEKLFLPAMEGALKELETRNRPQPNKGRSKKPIQPADPASSGTEDAAVNQQSP